MTIRRPDRRGFAHGTLQRWLVILAILMGLSLLAPWLLTFIFLRLPASVLEGMVSSLTGGQVRLAVPSGQVRSGQAELWVRDSARQEWLPWMPIEWTLEPVWRDRRLVAVLDTSVGSAEAGLSDFILSGVRIGLPPGLLLSGVNHPLAAAPWRGDIELTSQRFTCRRAAMRHDFLRCEGAAMLRWHGMGSSILPWPDSGDYVVAISARRQDDSNFRADVSTEAGVVVINGFAEGSPSGGRYQLVVSSEKALIEGLNSVIGARSRKRGASGEYILDGEW